MTFIPDARLESRAATLWRTHALLPGFDIEALVDKLQLGVLWEALPEAPKTVVLGALQPEGRRIVTVGGTLVCGAPAIVTTALLGEPMV